MTDLPRHHKRISTILAIIMAIVFTQLLVLPVGVVVGFYQFIFRPLLRDHWIPHLEDMVLTLLPSLLGGALGSAITILFMAWVFKSAALNRVRVITAAFWCIAAAIDVVPRVFDGGLQIGIIQNITAMAGLVAGLWVKLPQSVARRRTTYERDAAA